MQVRDGMTTDVLTIGPDHTLADVAKQMAARKVGAAVIYDADAAGPAILTERDILESVAAAQDPREQRAADHSSRDLAVAHPDWSLQQAAAAMVRGGFRHLVVMADQELLGILSMRDVVRCWTQSPP